ncbi:MAG: zinc ribbon domain-containing protein [Deltaproteobacteria bacterium]
MGQAATQDPPAPVTCAECSTENRSGARFCKACGGSIAPPPACPKCQAEIVADAKFCSECGAKLVGARPAPKPSAPPAAAPKPKPKASKAPPPPPKKVTPSSNITTNLLFFAAILMALVVVIYVMNKDEPKTISPFQGGPAPGAATKPPDATPPPSTAAAAPAAAPVKGRIQLSEALKNEGVGTIYLIVRNQGMPNRGPPIAVRKIDASALPVEFTVGPQDVMMPNMPFTGPFDLYARLDRDGNAMTKEPGDVINEQPTSGVKPGDANVEIVLDKRL